VSDSGGLKQQAWRGSGLLKVGPGSLPPEGSRMSTRVLALVFTALTGWTLAAGSAPGAQVGIEVSAKETHVGVPVVVRITISDCKHEPPAPVFPEITGVEIRSDGIPSRSSRMTVINGRMNQQVSLTYDYQLVPTADGSFTIPSLQIEVDGRKFRTEPQTVVVTKSETGDLLFADVKGGRDKIYLGESVDITLQIWIRPYHDRNFSVKLSEANMWGLIDNASRWGPFLEPLQQMLRTRQRPAGREVLRTDTAGSSRSYYLYELTTTICPDRPGKLALDDVNVVVSYPVRLGRDQSLFSMGELRIGQSRPLSAKPTVAPIEVKPVPTEGQPRYYRGAVGQFTIQAAAKPTEVTVGEPITLNLTISGNGRMEVVPPPPLPEIEELARDFKVPNDPLTGTVQQDAKTFTQSIRAKTDQVKVIPPIPFSYFDPRAEKFVTVNTRPIPLSVKATEKLSAAQVVDSATGQVRTTRSLTEVSSGILANYNGADEILGQQAFSPGWPAAMAMGLPPVAALVNWLVHRRRHRLRTDVGFARRRSARKKAQNTIHAASQMTEAELAAAVSTAIGGYVADRCNLPTGGLTRSAVTEHLTDRRVPAAVVEEVDRLLEQCEGLRYAAAGGACRDGLVQAAMAAIERLEGERFG